MVMLIFDHIWMALIGTVIGHIAWFMGGCKPRIAPGFINWEDTNFAGNHDFWGLLSVNQTGVYQSRVSMTPPGDFDAPPMMGVLQPCCQHWYSTWGIWPLDSKLVTPVPSRSWVFCLLLLLLVACRFCVFVGDACYRCSCWWCWCCRPRLLIVSFLWLSYFGSYWGRCDEGFYNRCCLSWAVVC